MGITINHGKTIFSAALLIDVPKPDFSMPFNALCLACTAVAILFGNMHSSLTKSVELASEDNQKLIVKIINVIKDKCRKLLKKKVVEDDESEKDDVIQTENPQTENLKDDVILNENLET